MSKVVNYVVDPVPTKPKKCPEMVFKEDKQKSADTIDPRLVMFFRACILAYEMGTLVVLIFAQMCVILLAVANYAIWFNKFLWRTRYLIVPVFVFFLTEIIMMIIRQDKSVNDQESFKLKKKNTPKTCVCEVEIY